jgi:uncharacterized membrane protein
MDYLPKNFHTQEMKQALYNEWIDSYYNDKDKRNNMILSLSAIIATLLSLAIITLNFITSQKLGTAIYSFSLIIFAIVIIGIISYIIYSLIKKESKLDTITKDIEKLNDTSKVKIVCKGKKISILL